MNPEIKKKSSS